MVQPQGQNKAPETNSEEMEIYELKIIILEMLNEPEEHRQKTKHNQETVHEKNKNSNKNIKAL